MRGILPNHVDFNCYVDASHASDIDTRRSITGYIFFISGGPVSWRSRMQTFVALSSMEAEYMEASAATQEAMWQARLLEQMGMRVDLPIKLYEDTNRPSCLQTTQETTEIPSTLILAWNLLVKHRLMVLRN